MCGILFLLDPRGVRPDPAHDRALEAIRVRGPDAQRLVYGPDFAVGSTRLAIIDPGHGADQPQWDATGRYVIAFNGEIYNYAELRERLVARGHRLRTHSDTETLLETIVADGWRAALARARGMFAFALYDTAERRLVVARDHFGQKPVYWSEAGGRLALASDVAALFALGADRAPDAAAYPVYMSAAGESGTRGAFPLDGTFFAGVRALPAGHVLIAQNGATRVERYFAPVELFDPAAHAANQRRSDDELVDELRALVDQAARRHLVSDVEVGILLSGGIDSSMVYWFARAHTPNLTAFAKISPGIEQIPLTVIPEILKRRPSDAHLAVQSPADYLPQLARFIAYSHAPSRWGGGPPMHSLCVAARRQGIKVLLGGDCADEVLGGYEHYEEELAPGRADARALGILARLDPASPFYDARAAGPYEAAQAAIRAEILQAVGGIADPWERAVQAGLLHDTTSFLQTCNLPHSDAYSMMTSVELRNPLLDLDLVRFAVNLPARHKAARHASGFYGKALFRELAARDVGAFIQCRKEGTRNFAMTVADPALWRFDRFRVRELLPIPAAMTKRQVVRLYNLELFHRLVVLGEADPLPALLTDRGAALAREAA